MSDTQLLLLIILIIVGIILLTTIAISIILFSMVRKYVNNNKEDLSGLYEELNQRVRKGNIVFLGDSLTEFYRTDEFLHDYSIYNRGIAGDTTDDVIARLDTNVLPMYPSKLFLQIGTNDLEDKKDAEYVVNNIKKILNEISTCLPNTKLYFISLYPVNPKAFPASKLIVGARKNSVIKEINSLLKEFCTIKRITYIDIFPHLIDDEGSLKKKYTIEGLHISVAGYSQISKILLSYLDE